MVGNVNNAVSISENWIFYSNDDNELPLENNIWVLSVLLRIVMTFIPHLKWYTIMLGM